jgi:hypothetical protein
MANAVLQQTGQIPFSASTAMMKEKNAPVDYSSMER